jgi:hypothetical protein
MSPAPPAESSFTALRRFVRRTQAAERCELCSRELQQEHEHLFEPANRKLLCSCEACAILFPSAPDRRYKRVPRRILRLTAFRLSDAQWGSLMLPISSLQDRVLALYPSPAGATESMLPLDAWQEMESENSALAGIEPDVEALLVNRIGYARGLGEAQYYIAPIDQCFKLTGLIRANWRGLSGGAEVWREIADFFARLKAHSSPSAENSHA